MLRTEKRVLLTRAVLPIMRAQHSGHIISITSVAGLIGFPGSGYYVASKHAIEGWSDAPTSPRHTRSVQGVGDQRLDRHTPALRLGMQPAVLCGGHPVARPNGGL